MLRLDIVGVRVELPSKQPIVLLREVGGERYLPIWIGAVEATAIAFAQEGVVTARPMTHDLLRDVLQALGNDLERVTINDLQDGVFFATLHFGSGVEVSARPSDAIALAMRMDVPVFGARRCSTRQASPCRTRARRTRRARSRSSASSSTTSRPRTSTPVPDRTPRPGGRRPRLGRVSRDRPRNLTLSSGPMITDRRRHTRAPA